MSFLSTGAGSDPTLCLQCSAPSGEVVNQGWLSQIQMNLTTALLQPWAQRVNKRLNGTTMLLAAGEISVQHWDKPNMVSVILRRKEVKKPA